MKRPGMLFAAFACGLAFASHAGAGTYADSLKKLRDDLMSRKFVAKVNLYEATVDAKGYVLTDPDREEIQKGMPILIDRIRVDFESIRIYMQHPSLHEKTWVEIEFGRRLNEDLASEREPIEAKLKLIFDEVKPPAPAGEAAAAGESAAGAPAAEAPTPEAPAPEAEPPADAKKDAENGG